MFVAPGGGISEDGGDSGPVRTDMCVFGAPDDSYETLRGYAQVFTRLMRRYKYLEKMFYEEMKKVFETVVKYEFMFIFRCIYCTSSSFYAVQ